MVPRSVEMVCFDEASLGLRLRFLDLIHVPEFELASDSLGSPTRFGFLNLSLLQIHWVSQFDSGSWLTLNEEMRLLKVPT